MPIHACAQIYTKLMQNACQIIAKCMHFPVKSILYPFQSMQDPSKIYSRSIQDQFKIHAESIPNPSQIHAESIQHPCEIHPKSMQGPCKSNPKSIQDPCKINPRSLKSLQIPYKIHAGRGWAFHHDWRPIPHGPAAMKSLMRPCHQRTSVS